jgi:hypothetical protein
MALNINGTTGISGVDGSVSAPALTGTDSNTGITFPSADTIKFSTGGVERISITNSGISGTGISSGGLEMAQEWRYGSYPLYYTDAELNGTWNATAASVGSAMTVSSGVFTFPSTGIYRIFSSNTSLRISNESRLVTIFTYLSTDSGSNFTLQRENYGNINNDASSISTFTNSVMLDITNTSTHKVKFKVASETQVSLSTTYVQFLKLGDT